MWRVSAQRSENGIISDECGPDGFTVLLRGPFDRNTTVHNVSLLLLGIKILTFINILLSYFKNLSDPRLRLILIKFRLVRVFSDLFHNSPYEVPSYELFTTC